MEYQSEEDDWLHEIDVELLLVWFDRSKSSVDGTINETNLAVKSNASQKDIKMFYRIHQSGKTCHVPLAIFNLFETRWTLQGDVYINLL